MMKSRENEGEGQEKGQIGLVVESEDNSEEMVNQVRPTGQLQLLLSKKSILQQYNRQYL